MQEKLLNRFELYYKNYADYRDYYKKVESEVTLNMEQKVECLLKEKDDDKLMQFVIDTQAQPKMHAIDLNLLKERVLTVYDFCKDLTEIPEEVKTELNLLKEKQNKQMYTIKAGKAEEVGPEVISFYKSQITPESLKRIMTAFENVTSLKKE